MKATKFCPIAPAGTGLASHEVAQGYKDQDHNGCRKIQRKDADGTSLYGPLPPGHWLPTWH